MGLESHDIDVALDDISGSDFAELVRAHVQAKGEKASRVGRIQANPAQSKHLETATMRVCDMAIDFVNLRSERYAEGSRIPTVVRGWRRTCCAGAALPSQALAPAPQEIGTPEEDASRRDLTINALFYNINSGEVEDFTGQGLADLRRGVIRTPLAPLTTFLDDPLRVLRTLRFATRYGFSLDAALIDAASSPEVRVRRRAPHCRAMSPSLTFPPQDALGAKVSRERVGTELSSTLHGPRPAAALVLLYQLRLWNVVFSMPAQPATAGDPDRAARLVATVARACAAVTGVSEAPMPGAPSFAGPEKEAAPAGAAASMVAPAASDGVHAVMLLATALSTVAGNTVPLRKGRTEGAPKHVVLNALKVPARAPDSRAPEPNPAHPLRSRGPPPLASSALETRRTWSSSSARHPKPPPSRRSRIASEPASSCARRVASGPPPSSSASHSARMSPQLMEARAHTPWPLRPRPNGCAHRSNPAQCPPWSLQPRGFVRAWGSGVWSPCRARSPCSTYASAPPLPVPGEGAVFTPPTQGKTLIAEVGVPRGPSVGVAMQRVIEWQILHRDGDAAQCAEYMRSLGAAAYSEDRGSSASGAVQSS